VERFTALLGEPPSITPAGDWRCLEFTSRRQGWPGSARWSPPRLTMAGLW